MKIKLKNIKTFLIAYLIFLVLGALFLFFKPKGEMVLWFNENRQLLANVYFLFSTKLVEWFFILFFIAILLNKSFGNAYITILTWLFSGIAAQVLKRVFAWPRPAAFFDETSLNLIGEMKIYYALSFPSGHTTTAFALFFLFSMFSTKKYKSLLFFVLALSVAISRVYLLQHFFIDIYFGSILGCLVATIVFVSVNSSNIFGYQNWKNKRIGHKNLF